MQIALTREYLTRVVPPAAAGIALGAITLLAYILFFVVSACCKCCSKKRGCCQRSKPLPYCRRLPYIVIVAVCATVGLVGGAMVLRQAPAFAGAVQEMVTDQVTKVRLPWSDEPPMMLLDRARLNCRQQSGADAPAAKDPIASQAPVLRCHWRHSMLPAHSVGAATLSRF